jgi:hypothetical protein
MEEHELEAIRFARQAMVDMLTREGPATAAHYEKLRAAVDVLDDVFLAVDSAEEGADHGNA